MRVYQIQCPEDVKHTYPCATEPPIPFWADGLPLCRGWFAENLGKYIEGFHLEDERSDVIGHIYWASSSHALAPYDIEESVAYLYCDWVQQQYRKKGGMHLLFGKFVEFLHSRGYKGIMVGSTDIEGYMHYRHFLNRGFHVMSESDGSKLLYYPISQASVEVKPTPARVIGKEKTEVEVLVIGSLSCPVGASAVLAIRKVAQEYMERVIVHEIPASRETLAQYGVADGIFINGKAKFFGPVNERQVKKAIEEELT